jgi:hypothetical protein
MNWRFQFDTDCSDTLALRAASAIDSSPASTDNTSRVLSSGGNALGRGIRNLQGQVKLRPEPDFLKRDTDHHTPLKSEEPVIGRDQMPCHKVRPA